MTQCRLGDSGGTYVTRALERAARVNWHVQAPGISK